MRESTSAGLISDYVYLISSNMQKYWISNSGVEICVLAVLTSYNIQETIQLWQRKCEDALQSLLVLGARRPVRRLASSAMGRIIERGDAISVYSRASTLQGWLVDGKRTDPMAYAGQQL